MQGIKETREAIIGVVALGVYIVSRAKDGFNMDDAADFAQKLLLDKEFAEKIQAAVDGIDNVPGEIKDLNFVEVLQLASVIPEIVNMLSKK